MFRCIQCQCLEWSATYVVSVRVLRFRVSTDFSEGFCSCMSVFFFIYGLVAKTSTRQKPFKIKVFFLPQQHEWIFQQRNDELNILLYFSMEDLRLEKNRIFHAITYKPQAIEYIITHEWNDLFISESTFRHVFWWTIDNFQCFARLFCYEILFNFLKWSTRFFYGWKRKNRNKTFLYPMLNMLTRWRSTSNMSLCTN